MKPEERLPITSNPHAPDKDDEKEKEKEKEETGDLPIWAKLVLGLSSFLVIIAPWALTRDLSGYDFSTTGQIGDTIAGTTAPLIGLISAFLVFYAFRAQVRANTIVLKGIEDEKSRYLQEQKDLVKRRNAERLRNRKDQERNEAAELKRQQNDLFTKLLDVGRIYNDSIQQLEHRTATGTSAIKKAIESAETGTILPNFNAIATIVNGMQITYKTAKDFPLERYQIQLIASQLFLVSGVIWTPFEEYKAGQDLQSSLLQSLYTDLLRFRGMLVVELKPLESAD